jgi:hypothetical protein
MSSKLIRLTLIAAAVCTGFGTNAEAKIMKYTMSIFDATAPFWGAPISVGLGNKTWTGGSVMVQFVGYAADYDIETFNIPAANGDFYTGSKVQLIAAQVIISDLVTGKVAKATFRPGEVFVGIDQKANAIGFASMIYPVYPYAQMLPDALKLTLPQYALDQPFNFFSKPAISCVDLAKMVQGLLPACSNASTKGPNFKLKTTSGDFFIESKGNTLSSFTSSVYVP